MFRDRIITTAIKFYSRGGLRGVNMDHIAEFLHISKRTIYEEFGSKEQLLEECFKREVVRIARLIQRAQAGAGSGLESILRTCMCLFECYAYLCRNFQSDIEMYPRIKASWEGCQSELEKQCEVIFLAGVKEGDFLPDQNYELVSAILIEQVWRLKPPFHLTMITTTLRGVCTAKGIEKMAALTTTRTTENING